MLYMNNFAMSKGHVLFLFGVLLTSAMESVEEEAFFVS